MREIVADTKLVAYCGLYCGACRSYLKEKCAGCHDNERASWCKVRACCMEHSYSSCAECTEFPNPHACRKFHNFFSQAIGFLFNSDRRACIVQTRQIGLQAHAEEMALHKRQTIKR